MISTSSNKIDEIVVPDEIETYVSMPSCLLQGCSNDLIIFRADGGNHFTHYGIYEGMFLIFDVSKDFKDGRLSCYLNNSGDDRPKFKVSDKPLDGYRHFGRLVASMKNYEVSVMQRMDIERVRTALKMLAPEERAIIQDFFFTESPIPVKELVEKYAMPKTSIYRKRDDALKKLKKILGNA